jgi:hypothetical protein
MLRIKLFQLKKDLRSLNSYNFGNENKKSFWKKYRKYIIGGTIAATTIGAAVAAGKFKSKSSPQTQEELNLQRELKREANIQQREAKTQQNYEKTINDAYQEGYKKFTIDLEKKDKIRYLKCKTQEKMSNQSDPSKQSECVKAGLKAREDKIKELEEKYKHKQLSAVNIENTVKNRKIKSQQEMISRWRKNQDDKLKKGEQEKAAEATKAAAEIERQRKIKELTEKNQAKTAEAAKAKLEAAKAKLIAPILKKRAEATKAAAEVAAKRANEIDKFKGLQPLPLEELKKQKSESKKGPQQSEFRKNLLRSMVFGKKNKNLKKY